MWTLVYNRFLSYAQAILLLGLAIVMLTPLLDDSEIYFGNRVPKYLFFSFLTTCCSLFLFIIRQSFPTIRYNFLNVSFLLFYLTICISQLAAYDQNMSLNSTFERMEGFWYYTALLVFFFIFSIVEIKQQQWHFIFIIWVAVAVFVSLKGLLFESGFDEGYRMVSTMGNASYLSHYLLSSLLLLVFLIDRQAFKKYYFPILLSSVILLLGIFYTFTRTTFIGIVLGGIVFLLFNQRTFNFFLLLKVKRVQMLLVIVAVTGSIFGYTYFQRLLNSVQTTNTLTDRFRLWGIALSGIRERPLLGWGTDNFPYVYEKYVAGFIPSSGLWYDRSHNVFLDWFINGGLLSGIAYIVIWALLLRYIWKTTLTQKQKALLTSWWFIAVFYLLFNIDYLANWIFLFLIALFVVNHLPGREQQYLKERWKIKTVFSLCMVGGLLVFFQSFLPTSYGYYLARQYSLTHNATDKLELTRKMMQLESPVNYNLTKSVVDYTYTVQNSDLSSDFMEDYGQTASAFVESEIGKRPPSVYLLYKKAGLEAVLLKNKDAISTYNELLKINPNYSLAYLRIGYLYFMDSQLENAIRYFSQAEAVSPEMTEASLMKLRAQSRLNPDYDFEVELNKLPGEKLTDFAYLVGKLFRETNKLPAYYVWIWKGGYYSDQAPTPQVLFEWATCAYEVGGVSELEQVLLVYNTTFHCSPRFSAEVLELANKGIDPSSKLLEYQQYCEE
jgi:O-antigen ligase